MMGGEEEEEWKRKDTLRTSISKPLETYSVAYGEKTNFKILVGV